jgi:hypothetical protein
MRAQHGTGEGWPREAGDDVRRVSVGSEPVPQLDREVAKFGERPERLDASRRRARDESTHAVVGEHLGEQLGRTFDVDVEGSLSVGADPVSLVASRRVSEDDQAHRQSPIWWAAVRTETRR